MEGSSGLRQTYPNKKNKMNKKDYAQKLKREIVSLQQLQKILLSKNPSHDFLQPLIGNAIATMADLLCYLEEKHPYLPVFDEAFFHNREAAMHRVFFADFHVATEDGLRKIIRDQNFKVEVNRSIQAQSIVEKIKSTLKDYSLVTSELKKIIKLGGNFPTFNDYLNTVLNNIADLDAKYKVGCRAYFDAINIIRNKVSHSDMTLNEEEKTKLTNAKFKNAISAKGELQMTFEGYKLLVTDVIRFFDKLSSHL